MKYTQKIQKLKQNSKALSPVVASIILIAVTVAVSIAVAAWMGGLAGTFMETDQLKVNTPVFEVAQAGQINVTVTNTGTSPVTISEVRINGATATDVDYYPKTSTTLAPNAQVIVTVNQEVVAGNNYQVSIITNKNNAFTSTGIAY
ncbi:MAG: archaellin/type IV pilin N-terminal domain-containing protein [Candidatus Bathyarchaeia archaeon]|jgi:flagellin-like protein